jgi:integrase
MCWFLEADRAEIYSRGTWRQPGNGGRRRAAVYRRFLPQHRLHAQQERSLERAHRLSNPARGAVRLCENIRLGFLRYHRAIKMLGYKLLFPELKANSDRTPLGDVFHGDWIKVQDVAIPNAGEERKSFHSFRKTSANDLKDAGVVSELRADILGHGGKNITEERYASAAKLKQMLEALEKLPDYTSHLAAHDIRLRGDVLANRQRTSAKPRRRIKP